MRGRKPYGLGPNAREPGRRWRRWPQGLAANQVLPLFRRGRAKIPGTGYQYTLLNAAKRLSARFTPELPLEKIVVFYPRRLYGHISKNLYRTRASAGLDEFKGLIICSNPELRSLCVAFLISDVEAHRTPADAYHVDFRANGNRRRKIEPVPLYTAEESNLGYEITE